ncbi:hypothetical protein T636_A4641 [Enterobacter hormaechei subsp. xiangfangensis]|uniref:Putative minor silk ampullate protein n=1 Tax=Klebsiella pneumoniae subsp. ozaenae TaxID=574 RepID=U3RGI9_KLEPO|nr:putative minor silk ampullate protein [Klebsiella pneumoniae subsp. ozaenae]KHG47429.1 hypothetical protein T636_A4641 [Enterobacter hormaechei subsp. xiangfangensis]UWX37840.1 hypothetical protein KK473_p0370 [Klebsiella pneumoniae]
MALPPISDGTRDKQRQTPGVTPSGPLCCAAHRAGSRLAPLTRAAAANASGLRPPRSAWPPGFALRAGAWRLASAASQVRRYLSCPVIKPFRWRGSFRL